MNFRSFIDLFERLEVDPGQTGIAWNDPTNSALNPHEILRDAVPLFIKDFDDPQLKKARLHVFFNSTQPWLTMDRWFMILERFVNPINHADDDSYIFYIHDIDKPPGPYAHVAKGTHFGFQYHMTVRSSIIPRIPGKISQDVGGIRERYTPPSEWTLPWMDPQDPHLDAQGIQGLLDAIRDQTSREIYAIYYSNGREISWAMGKPGWRVLLRSHEHPEELQQYRIVKTPAGYYHTLGDCILYTQYLAPIKDKLIYP